MSQSSDPLLRFRGASGVRGRDRAAPGGDGLSANKDRILSAIDDRTALVAISHVLFKSVFVLNIPPIAENPATTARAGQVRSGACNMFAR